AAGRYAYEPARGGLGEVGREIRDYDDAKRLGNLTRLGVILLDRVEFVAQILLNHVLHVLGQIGQPLIDVLRLRPDPISNHRLVEIRQVHEAGEVLAQSHGIDDRETDFAGWHTREKTQHHRLERLHRLIAC